MSVYVSSPPPPAHTLEGSAAKISMQDFLMIWRGKKEEKIQQLLYTLILSWYHVTSRYFKIYCCKIIISQSSIKMF